MQFFYVNFLQSEFITVRIQVRKFGKSKMDNDVNISENWQNLHDIEDYLYHHTAQPYS